MIPASIQSITMQNISKEYDSIAANKGISLKVFNGEILGILGENGAGKTTLMNILYGMVRPDSGTILINDAPAVFQSSNDAIQHGIGMVHQHFMLIPEHTVLENITLGYKNASFINPQNAMRKKLLAFAKHYGLKIHPDAYVWQLSVGEMQRVEIVKTLIRGAHVIIMDEPTSVLTPMETNELFTILKQMASEGHIIIFISHKLEEVMEICSRVIVLKQGSVVGEVAKQHFNKHTLAKMMVGREIVFHYTKKKIVNASKVLEVENISIKNDNGLYAVKNLSFSINRGEIFGIAGVSGNGQKELVEGLTGLRKIEKGKIFIYHNNKKIEITNKNPLFIAKHGISLIPEERLAFGIVSQFSLHENMLLRLYDNKELYKNGFLQQDIVKNAAEQVIKRYNIAASNADVKVGSLSGGNIQKFILGREIEQQPELLIASHPTYGLDVGATEYVQSMLMKITDSNRSVLLISEDLDEIMQLSNRTGVLYEGQFMGIINPDETSLEDIGLMMAGSLNTLDSNNE